MHGTIKKLFLGVICIVINIVGRLIAGNLKFPIWFDMTGTVLATYYTGIWGGVVVGFFSNIVVGVFDSNAVLYTATWIIATIVINIFVNREYLNGLLKCTIAGFWLGVVCAVASVPINMIFYGGYAGNVWGDTLVDMLRWMDVSPIVSCFAGELVVETIDKMICMMLVYGITKVPERVKTGHNIIRRLLSLIPVMLVITSVIMQPLLVYGAENEEEYFLEKVYNNTSGMVSSEANVICETMDGYIWIGSYAGLTRYDGNEFEFIREGGLVNVVSMMEDSRGRLWIGTNDAGIARYENGKYTYFTVDSGLPSNSIRCFTQDSKGNVYVGTSDKICRFDENDTIEIISQDITFARYMAEYRDIIVVTDNKGGLYTLKEGQIIKATEGKMRQQFFSCVAVTGRGFVCGTAGGEVYILEVDNKGIRIKQELEITANEITAVFEDSKGRIWVATDSGFGFFNSDGIYNQVNVNGFSTPIDCFHEDYQGNIWLGSTRHGVMKLSESLFMNVFDHAQISDKVVNAVAYYDGNYFCGTDEGLVILDRDRKPVTGHYLLEKADKSRIRAVYAGSDRNLWLCTYSGLMCYSPDSGVRIYNVEQDDVTSDRFRCILELDDGTIVAGTADGINYIREGSVINKLTEEQGLNNTQILSMIQDKNGRIWAGSDGGGIYIIENGKLVSGYDTSHGLTSNVILRIVPYYGGYIVVTSNSLCHIDFQGNVKRLKNFPYFNNYDIVIKDTTAYITCSAGIYIMELEDLVNDIADEYTYYGANEGLLSGLTANSWNCIGAEGDIYLCSNSGVIVFNDEIDNAVQDIKFGIESVECSGNIIPVSEDGVYEIPSDARTITVNASVRNYAYRNIRVRFYVQEFENSPKIHNWNEIESLQITDFKQGQYHICMEILDSDGGDVIAKQTYAINRKAHTWESVEYRVYLVVVFTIIFISIIISLVSVILFVIRKNELEEVRIHLAQTVDERTSEIVRQQKKTKNLLLQTITALSEAVDAKDRYTSGHSKRVAEYARMIAARLGKSKEEQERIYRAGLLHDIGKIRISADIINKKGRLTEEEYNIIKIHPVTGYHILRGITDDGYIAMGAKYHHERYDGTGYPNGLAGEKIPEVARILGVADAYDAMASNRSYRNALPQDVVRGEIEQCKGTQFDPQIADIMLQMIDEDEHYTMKQPDSMKRSVLVVDDDIMSTKLIAHIMKDESMYQIVAAHSGMQALEMLKQQKFDLILLDMCMPDMNGLETLKRIRVDNDTPVAIITGNRDLEVTKEFQVLGCDDYVTKPFLPILIKEVIHNMVERTYLGDSADE